MSVVGHHKFKGPCHSFFAYLDGINAVVERPIVFKGISLPQFLAQLNETNAMAPSFGQIFDFYLARHSNEALVFVPYCHATFGGLRCRFGMKKCTKTTSGPEVYISLIFSLKIAFFLELAFHPVKKRLSVALN